MNRVIPASVVETFYEGMWSSRTWSEAEPNADEQARLAAIVSLLTRGLRSGIQSAKLLDLGCGRGWLTQQLSAYGTAIGADPVSSSIKRARELFPHLRFIEATASDLLQQFGPAYFDAIVCSEVIEHIENNDKHAFLGHVRELLSSTGIAILTTPRGELWERWHAVYPNGQPVEAWISEADLDSLASRAGLDVRCRTRVFLPGLPYDSPVSRFLNRRPFKRSPRLLNMPLIRRFVYACSIYQVVALGLTKRE